MATSTIKRSLPISNGGDIKSIEFSVEAGRLCISFLFQSGGYAVMRVGITTKELIVDDYRNGFSRNTIVSS